MLSELSGKKYDVKIIKSFKLNTWDVLHNQFILNNDVDGLNKPYLNWRCCFDYDHGSLDLKSGSEENEINTTV